MAGQVGTAGSMAGPAGINRVMAWGIVGVVAQVAFTAGCVVAETWQGPGYSDVTDTISDLQAATAPHVRFPIACFAIGGIGTFCFAVFGLRPALAGAGWVAVPLCLLLLFAAEGTDTASGLAERALATSCTLWMAAVAIALIRISRCTRPAAREPGMHGGMPGIAHGHRPP